MSPISDIEELPRPTPQVLKFLARPSKQARSGYVDLSKFPNIQLEILSLSIYLSPSPIEIDWANHFVQDVIPKVLNSSLFLSQAQPAPWSGPSGMSK